MMLRSLGVIILFFPMLSFAAAPFTITSEGVLPHQVPRGESVTALFRITNESNQVLDGVFVKNYPPNVKPSICNTATCPPKINLEPNGSVNDSCQLKLSISGPVDTNDPNPSNHLVVCLADGVTCAEPLEPLKVVEVASSPFIGVASGSYTDFGSVNHPLVAASNNDGSDWFYPRRVFDRLDQIVDPNFISGLLPTTSCSGAGKNAICIAAGSYCTDSSCVGQFPLVAVGSKQVTKWNYPISVYQNLPAIIGPSFVTAAFFGSSCNGSGTSGICMATGSFCTDANCTKQQPLLTYSVDRGKVWTYPKAIFENLTTTIDPNYVTASLPNGSCSGSNCTTTCIATGSYCTDEFCSKQFPLVALTNDKGQTWNYPHSVFENLLTRIGPDFLTGFFNSSSCTGSNSKTFCLAAGQFFTQNTSFPWLAFTRDRGQTWTYPTEIFRNLTTQIDNELVGGFFNSASCTDSGKSTICIAVGDYFTTEKEFPLLALSKDAGRHWAYPSSIFSNLPMTVDPLFARGFLNSASCSGLGVNSICMAAGGYCTDLFCNNVNPLLAQSRDGGKTWAYPSAIYKNLQTTIDPNFISGFFNAVSCNITDTKKLCIASGQFTTDITTFPLIAVSMDGGLSWSYPPNIYQNLQITIGRSFLSGFFTGGATTGAKMKFRKLSLRPPQWHSYK